MNKELIDGYGKEPRANAKHQRGKLANDRLDEIAAKRDQLEGEIQQAYAIIKEAAEKQGSFWAV
ncbi:MAG: hypothetical protein R6T87_06075 [Marinobacter sp.]